MANPRALDRRRKSIRNIRKITRTMELIATARFKKAMDRATAAAAYTEQITHLVSDLVRSGAEVRHPLLEARSKTDGATILMLTSNRGLCGGYNSNIVRLAQPRIQQLSEDVPTVHLEVSGKRGIAALRFREIRITETYTEFEDQPRFDDVERIADRYLDAYAVGDLDRLDIVYTRFIGSAKQEAVVETLLPMGSLVEPPDDEPTSNNQTETVPGNAQYEFLPDVESILSEIVPTSFKVKLFKCFLDAAVSEQIARMVAMKSATENASDIIKMLSRMYNRARQSRITSEISEIIGGVEALSQ